MQIIEKKLSELVPYAKNPRKNDTAVKAVAASIQEFGFRQPLVIDAKNEIIVGHTRLKAAQQLGLDTVPCVVAENLTEKQIQAYRILDNKVGEVATWDFDLLDDKALNETLEGFEFWEPVTHQTKKAPIQSLKPHPKNYKTHPEDQLGHLAESIRENGVYRNVVIAKDGTILAGHAVVQACKILNLAEVPVLQLSIDPNSTKAIKLLTADNEISHLAEVDDRALSMLLKEVLDADNLFGTGYDEKMLANLIFVTRPSSEIKNMDEAAEWLGLPGFDRVPEPMKTIVQFETVADRAEFCRLLGIEEPPLAKERVSMWWPEKEKEDLASIKIEG